MSTSDSTVLPRVPLSARTPHAPSTGPGHAGSVPPADRAAQPPEVDAPEEVASALRPAQRGLTQSLGACVVSMVVHAVLLVMLGLLMVPDYGRNLVTTLVMAPAEPIEPRDEISVELEEELEAATSISDATSTSAPEALAAGGAESTVLETRIELESSIFEQAPAAEIAVASPVLDLPSASQLFEVAPEGAVGNARAVVGDYQEALDRITREIMLLLDRQEVLVIWCFDQSESMKDDQREIRKRIQRIYQELGLLDTATNDRLLTSVISYGRNLAVHTSEPTSDLGTIQAAIDAVPVDPSGEEIMCEAVGRAIANYRSFARKGRRQLVLILVTDESGDRANNLAYLEQAIAEAKAARCRIYTLGREAVFGYPLAFMRWKHPQTGRIHWLPVDRGPETAFVEQLQTNGFRRRHDAFSSGFGPYEQTRLCRETGGVFFMLPTVEQDLVQGEKRRYRLDAMTAYFPDLRSRLEVLDDRERRPVRTLLWKVISDLDPYNERAGRVIEMRIQFSLDRQTFAQQARTEQAKTLTFLEYLAWAENLLEENRNLRDEEVALRWQANYDLILAQTIAYQARLYEYGAALEDALRTPPTAPLTRSPNLTLARWDIRTRKELRREAESGPYIERAREHFERVIATHPDTPWASRAEWELRRGFGIELAPDYDPPYREVSNPTPPPKL